MDRSHTMIRLRLGDLKVAVPTNIFNNLVRQAEKHIAFENEMCEPMSFSQRQSRVEEFVLNHICEQSLQDAELHIRLIFCRANP
jgi:hypothetical protein